MAKIGKRHSKQAKFDAVIALIKGNETIAQLCDKYKVHQSTLFQWKKEFFDAGPDVFDKDKKSEKSPPVDQLQRKIGELTMDIDFLRKALGR